jgi:hypothetical protein
MRGERRDMKDKRRDRGDDGGDTRAKGKHATIER